MLCGRRCAGIPSKPSGHSAECSHYSQFRSDPGPITSAPFGGKDHQKFPDEFHGPYKDFKPPGDRTPAVGEKQWGDVPYLPSYQDKVYQEDQNEGLLVSLFSRGPFYPGVSETHDAFSYPGKISPREFHEYVRHYEEPGMKHNKSITQSDFGPIPKWDRSNLDRRSQFDNDRSEYVRNVKPLKNTHGKVLDSRSVSESQLIYIDEPPPVDGFRTENTDNYICYQRPKAKTKLLSVRPVKVEEFLKRIRTAHKDCPYGPYEICDCDKSETDEKSEKEDASGEMFRNPWILYPKNQSAPKELMNMYY